MTSDLDVEALLDSVVNANSDSRDDKQKPDRRRDDRDRDGKRRERSRERRRKDRDRDADVPMKSPSERGSAHGSHSSRRRSRSRDRRDRGRYGDDRNGRRGSGGDFYRSGPRQRTRSRSPDPDRYYRPPRREREERGDVRDNDRGKDRGRANNGRRSNTRTPPPNEDERDRRTVFVQQLAARLRTKDLFNFFEKAGPVKEAQIVKDRVSGRSKGVGYVEFKNEESVPLAIQLTGQKLLGIPIIAQNAEAEKNRAARNTEGGTSAASGVPFHRLYVGNIHFSITESDLQNVFEPFGELEFVQLQKEDAGRSRGYGFVQFRDPDSAKEALEKMNGFELAGRPIRVGLGNDKFTPESTANLLQRFGQGNGPSFQGSAFSGHGGRGSQAGGSGGSFDRIGGRDNEKSASGAGALDDTDVAGVNFNNYSRDALMRKLARTEDTEETNGTHTRTPMAKPRVETKPLPVNVSQASRCVMLKNCFDHNAETGVDWVKELEEEVREECEAKYGHVVHIAVEPNSAGEIYIKFDSVASGEKAILGLNGRYFGGFQITAQPVVDALYSSLFSRTRAM